MMVRIKKAFLSTFLTNFSRSKLHHRHHYHHQLGVTCKWLFNRQTHDEKELWWWEELNKYCRHFVYLLETTNLIEMWRIPTQWEIPNISHAFDAHLCESQCFFFMWISCGFVSVWSAQQSLKFEGESEINWFFSSWK